MKRPVLAALVAAALVASVLPRPLSASDHADPITLGTLEAGLTGLFAFPDGDRLVLALGVVRGLTSPGPFDLEPYEYAVHMDLHSPVSYASAEDRTRYGGTVVEPSGISADVDLRFRLHDDATLAEKSFEGLRSQDGIEVWSGLRDDPFILPSFFGTNIVAIVVSIPMSDFPEGQQDWLIWGTTSKDGKQIDHVGRANRTQLARFDFLNTLPPSEHVAAIRKAHDRWERLSKLAGKIFPPLVNLITTEFAIRHYDFAPDVMIFTTRFPPGFPNGRRLTDDVALLTCQTGDCVLIESAFIQTKEWPRQTINDKEFLTELPYLAPPWPPKEEQIKEPPRGCWPVLAIGFVLVVLLVLVALWRCWRRRKKEPAPLVR